ncbi:type II restriction endonuclease [Pseudomonas frederiksbergensis]
MEGLRQHFTGVSAKYLSAVHAPPRPNQHEIGSNAFVKILGNSGERRKRTKYLSLEPAISIHQFSDLEAHGLRLVVPAQLHITYTNAWRS